MACLVNSVILQKSGKIFCYFYFIIFLLGNSHCDTNSNSTESSLHEFNFNSTIEPEFNSTTQTNQEPEVNSAIILNQEEASNKGNSCFIPNKHNNESAWKLVWEDGFDGHNLSDSEWEVEHESVFCGGNGIQQLSCNVLSNIHLLSSTLSLWAQHTPYYEYAYTGATLTTRRFFSYGRWEFRLSLPLGRQLRSTLFTRHQGEAYWHEAGQVDIVSNTGEPILYRGVHFANSSSSYTPADHILTIPLESLHNEFHLYGIEWNEAGIRFFIDDNYSKTIKFESPSKGMSNQQQIRLQIGVGGQFFAKPMPDRFELLGWKCPALVCDYIRIFEPISNIKEIPECPDISLENSSQVLNDICEQAMALGKKEEDSGLPGDLVELGKSNWLPLLIVGLLLLFLLLLSYLIYQIIQVKRRVAKEASRGMSAFYENGDNVGGDNTGDYYENVYYDTVNQYEAEPGSGKERAYVPLSEGQPRNEYLEMKDGDYKEKSSLLADKETRKGNDYEPASRMPEYVDYETLTKE